MHKDFGIGNELKMNYIYTPLNLEVVVSSFGGVGTTFFAEFISQYKKVNSIIDKDSLKHSPYPPVTINSDQKFIYLFGNPVTATISLFRRNFQFQQSKKYYSRIGAKKNPVSKEMTLEQYASEGVDRFGLRNQFYNWYDASFSNQILFVRYETLYSNLETIFDFLGLPEQEIEAFPPYRPRKSKESDIEENVLNQLTEMHQRFLSELQQIPDVKLKKAEPLKTVDKVKNFNDYCVSLTCRTFIKNLRSVYRFIRSCFPGNADGR